MHYRIAAIFVHGPAVREFHLAPADGVPLPSWEPGAHLELSFASRTGLVFRNAYSIVGETRGMLRIAVQREDGGRGGSRVLHRELAPGMLLDAGDPIASFRLHTGASRTVLVAGGIGITPLLPMAHALEAAGAEYELHFIARERRRLVLERDWRSLKGRVATYLTASQGRPDLAAMIGQWRPGSELHACGPGPLLDAIREPPTPSGGRAPTSTSRASARVGARAMRPCSCGCARAA